MQTVNVIRVYRDTNGIQRWVDYESDTGERGCVTIEYFISGMRQRRFKEGNFVIENNRRIRGRDCALQFVEVMTRSEMVKKYPGRWLAVYPFFKHPSSVSEDSGVVIKVLIDDNEYSDFREKCQAKGVDSKYYYFYTTPMIR